MSLCPYCEKELKFRLSAQFIDEVDPKFIEVYQEGLKRYQLMIEKTLSGYKIDTRTWFSPVYSPFLAEFPPMVELITCVNCNTATHVNLHKRAYMGQST
jgi:hypothetical protein